MAAFDFKQDTVEKEDFFSAFDQPMQEYPEPEFTEAEPEAEPEPESELFAETENDFTEMNTDIAGFLVEGFDGVAAWLLGSFVANNNQTDQYRLPAQETAKLKQALYMLLPKHQLIMPPWLVFVVVLVSAYTPVVSAARQDGVIAEQAAEIERLKHAQTVAELKKDMPETE